MVGRLLGGRYLIGRRIARGGMATVYEATDNRLQRVVAVKVMHAALASDADFVKRFRREARSAARLSHPNIVAVFDQGSDGETVYLTMEYVAGRTLRHVLHESGPMAPLDALELIDPILRALSAAHQAGLVHRDVKPENVLIGEDGTVKVADFGVARGVGGATNTATQGLLIGTVSYLAPEQLTQGKADARADVYSVGILLYEMLTGRKPHEGDTPIQVAYQHVNHDVPAPSILAPETPRFVDGLVLRATARDADVRPADANVFLHQVRRAREALLQGVDDPGLADDLLSFRRAAAAGPSTAPTAPVSLPWADGGSGGTTALAPAEQTNRMAPVPSDVTAAGSADAPEGPAHGGAGTDDASTSRVPGGGWAGPGGVLQSRSGRQGLAVFALVLALILIACLGVWWLGIARYTHVPSLLEVNPNRLEQLEEETGLAFRVVGREYSESIAKGLIVRTSPEPSARIRKGGTVQVWISRGPERYRVPDLSGVTPAEARRMLTNSNLRVDGVTHEYHDTIPKGSLIRTTPEAGEMLRRNSPVALVVSRGPQPIDIPSVVGQDLEAARQTLSDAGLDVVVEKVFHPNAPADQVVAQDPGPGRGHRGDRIVLEVSKGPAFTVVPDVVRWNVDDAEKRLRELGFTVETRQAGIHLGLNIVVRQTPAGNTTVPTGSVVVLEYA